MMQTAGFFSQVVSDEACFFILDELQNSSQNIWNVTIGKLLPNPDTSVFTSRLATLPKRLYHRTVCNLFFKMAAPTIQLGIAAIAPALLETGKGIFATSILTSAAPIIATTLCITVISISTIYAYKYLKDRSISVNI